MGKIIGIDLGTTNSCVAVITADIRQQKKCRRIQKKKLRIEKEKRKSKLSVHRRFTLKNCV